ncbi:MULTISPECIES: metal ABC transporter ATP-binding protein [Bacillaceae]|uniref:Metal ABC transporter ATP-binding protein n=2 Tax=Cytobacillus firmus TaxID=1399 RepID=A0AA46PQI4_CYTFI|nr:MULTISPECIES: metal ABC transporter ATP-binding protein [Bacillaceae]TFI48761.1 metal ABC transporter ATP-binding protein [Diaphorobacter sp. DS2]MBG9447589.1 manganese transporter [Cytobacillus firmus]MBG9451065.1 manganese transporter [Cytobacillus firmus]MCC3646530.1 metal ABC transporter ATP-binding protein [Cytobacillus oceanisediminis]MCS0653127.1 metal ABC transporter ATP-binding protein [Cytobacillus firmus]
MNDPAISIQDLHVSYFGNEAVTGVSLSVNTGNLVGIIGPNGAGKSTFLKAMLNLIPKDKGAVTVLGKPITEVRKSIAYVPQRNDIDWDFPITVLDAVLIGTYPHLKLFRRPKKKDKEWAMECLQRVGMQEFSKRQIGELSGGQQQRVFLARALAQKADLFFLDEPFVGVDVSSEETIVNILKELCRQGKTVIVVHHDLSKANDYFNQLILLNKELISFGTVEEVFKPDVIAKAYQGQFAFMNEIGVSL